MTRRGDPAPSTAEYRERAQRCRQQAKTVSGHGVRASLLQMAAEYEQRAAELERAAA